MRYSENNSWHVTAAHESTISHNDKPSVLLIRSSADEEKSSLYVQQLLEAGGGEAAACSTVKSEAVRVRVVHEFTTGFIHFSINLLYNQVFQLSFLNNHSTRREWALLPDLNRDTPT